MFPPKQPPKRIGGAPFSHARRKQAGHPFSARGGQSKAEAPSQAPSSAREASSRSGERPTSPCTDRAAEYYGHLLGQDSGVRQDWNLVQEIDALDHFNSEEENRRKAKEKNVNYQAQLRQQLQTRKDVNNKCRDVWKQWRDELEEDVVQYAKEEEMKKAYVKSEQRRFNQEREKQLADIHRRKVEQKEADKKLEKEMMELAEQSKKRQDALDLERKMQQRRDMKEMKNQADLAVEIKKSMKQEEVKRDVKMQKEYEALMEQQERNRVAYFQGIRDKQQKLLASYEAGVGNELARLAEEDDARARKHADARYQKEQADHAERQRWRRALAESGRAAVEQQLAFQAEERQRHRLEEQQYLDKVRKEAAIAQAKELDKEQKKKEAVQANAEFVRKQIQEKAEKQTPAGKAQKSQMNDIEKQLNREKLARACDPERIDGLQSLLGKKRAEYKLQSQHVRAVGLPS